MRASFSGEISRHPLRDEIVANSLAGTLIDRGGPTVVMDICQSTGVSAPEVVKAFAFANGVFNIDLIWEQTDRLDSESRNAIHNELLRGVQQFLRRAMVSALRRGYGAKNLRDQVAVCRKGVAHLAQIFRVSLTEAQSEAFSKTLREFELAGVPAELAATHAALPWLEDGPALVEIAASTGRDLEDVARIHFNVGDSLGIWRLRTHLITTAAPERLHRVSLIAVSSLLTEVQRSIVEDIIVASPDAYDIDAWLKDVGASAQAARLAIDGLLHSGPPTVDRLALATNHVALIRELAARRRIR
jgi:glutamate dehydrogenase